MPTKLIIPVQDVMDAMTETARTTGADLPDKFTPDTKVPSRPFVAALMSAFKSCSFEVKDKMSPREIAEALSAAPSFAGP